MKKHLVTQDARIGLFLHVRYHVIDERLLAQKVAPAHLARERFLVALGVVVHVCLAAKASLADVTSEGPRPRVTRGVVPHVGVTAEAALADVALKTLVVGRFVGGDVCLAAKALVAELALETLRGVGDQVILAGEAPLADRAHVGCPLRVHPLVVAAAGLVGKAPPTKVARIAPLGVRLFVGE